jgi:DnaK suppressor protein
MHRMSTPSTDHLRPLRQRLSERANALRRELQQGRGKLADDVRDTSVVLDGKDQTNIAIQAGIDSAELNRDIAELTLVQAAITRLDAGRYGICLDCGEAIAPARLAAQPWAPRCLACQSLREQQRLPRPAP